VVLLTASALGCAGTETARDATTTSIADRAAPTTAAGGEIEHLTLDLVDVSRPTAAGASSAESPARTLVTEVRLPPTDAPAPLIVFAHGLSGHPDVFTQLLDAWAQAGFVVAAPAFPLTNRDVPDAWQNWWDVQEQPDDVSFVIDELLAAGEDDGSPVHGRIDPDRIGVGGLSLGGATTYLVGLNDASRDPRVDAAMVLDGVAFDDRETGTFLEPSGTPAFVAHCADDPVADVRIARDAYALLAPPKYLVVLDGTCHAEAFEDTPHERDDIATAMTSAFWLAYLADGEPAELDAVLDAAGGELEWDAEG
jgi:predicted dienelactone hydrolase